MKIQFNLEKQFNRVFNDTLTDTVFYHGTDAKGIEGIIKERKIGTNYFDGEGFYLSKEFKHALNHGQYILVFKQIELSRLETDDVNDGFFHRGSLSIDLIDNVICSSNDKRVINDMINSLLKEY